MQKNGCAARRRFLTIQDLRQGGGRSAPPPSVNGGLRKEEAADLVVPSIFTSRASPQLFDGGRKDNWIQLTLLKF